jgi:hypothetical protein
MQLDAFEFVQGLSGQVAFAAVGTTDDGYILDDEEADPLTVTARNAPHVRAALTTDIAYHRLTHHSRKTVIKTSLPFGLNLVTTVTVAPSEAWPFTRYFHSSG